MSSANRVAKNTLFLYGRMAITVFVSLYSTRLILGALGISDFGIFNVVGGAVAMLAFLNAAMASVSQRFMSYAQGEGDEQKQKYTFNVSVVLHILIAIIVVLILEISSFFLFTGVLEIPENRITAAKIVFQFMLLTTFINIVSVPYDAVINAHENMLFVAILGIVEAFLKLLIAIYVTQATFDKLISYSVLTVLLPMCILIVRAIYCHKNYIEVMLRPFKYWNKSLFREMTGFAGWSFMHSASSIISMQGMALILNSFFGVLLNAAQGIAAQVSGQLMAFSNTMLKALNPVIVKSEGGRDRVQMLEASMTGSKLSYFLLAFFATPALLEMPFILAIWLKDVPEYAVVFCRLRLVAMFISQLTIVFPTAIGAIGKIKNMSLVSSFIWILLLPVSYIMFRMGASPVVLYINFISMTVLLSVVSVYYLRTLGGLSVRAFLINVVGRSIATSVVAMFLAFLPMIWLPEGFIRLFLVILLSSVGFIISLVIIGLTQNEKKVVRTIIITFTSRLRK